MSVQNRKRAFEIRRRAAEVVERASEFRRHITAAVQRASRFRRRVAGRRVRSVFIWKMSRLPRACVRIQKTCRRRPPKCALQKTRCPRRATYVHIQMTGIMQRAFGLKRRVAHVVQCASRFRTAISLESSKKRPDSEDDDVLQSASSKGRVAQFVSMHSESEDLSDGDFM